MIAVHDVSGLILAGGRGSRMQQPGQPAIEKGLLRLHGKPLVAWADKALPDGLASRYVSANRHADVYGDYGVVVADDSDLVKGLGPLAGVVSALRCIDTQWLYVVPVDVPVPPDQVFQMLLQHINQHRCDLAYACTDRPQPLFMLLNKSLLPSLQNYLFEGSRQVQRWQRAHGQAVYFDAPTPGFFNINTPDDLQLAHRQFTLF